MRKIIVTTIAALSSLLVIPSAHADSHDPLMASFLPTVCARHGEPTHSVARVRVTGGQGALSIHTVQQANDYSDDTVYRDVVRHVPDSDKPLTIRVRIPADHHTYIRVMSGDRAFTLTQGVRFAGSC